MIKIKILVSLEKNFWWRETKIALARSYYRSPEILLFDEATSAMDEKSEDEIINSFRKLLNDKTVIFITHKKNYSKLFDRVINLDDQL